eukprot:CAMPEP_0204415172 /NCGR_PEP_ID=MMETSP0470-20130426/23193_1 /ASSEMBLY_ACC=CAM_ASM_000385 /TAXON_ID=2969 /ORGANISM="Oxyrrhis marina" /LENGTH=46 /DNA_ID= /DNA_START= /DNA_END= /DNA_ORIENTATION=
MTRAPPNATANTDASVKIAASAAVNLDPSTGYSLVMNHIWGKVVAT